MSVSMKTALVLILAIAGSIPGSGQDRLVDLGKALMDLNNKNASPNAIEAFHRYWTAKPEGSRAQEALTALGKLYAREGKRDLAYVTFLKLSRCYSDPPQETQTLAWEMTEDGALKPIQEKLKTLTGKKADGAFAARYFYMITELKDLVYPKLNPALIEECRLFLETAPEDEKAPLVAEWLGDLLEQDRPWDALDSYLRVVTLYENSDRVLGCRLKIGMLYADRLKMAEQAAAVYGTILESGADSAILMNTRWNLAELYERKLSNYEKAAAEYQKVADSFPSSPRNSEALFRKAVLQEEKLKLPDEAIATYGGIVENFRETDWAARAQEAIGDVYDKSKQYPEAVKAYESFAELFPDHERAAEVLFKAGEVAEKKIKQPEQAVAIYERIVEKYPDAKIAARSQKKIDLLKGKGAK